MLGKAGEYPFTRGIHPLMYRKQPWTMRQYTGFGNAADTNARFKYLIANGQTGLNVAFDLPTQCGLDSDDALADGEVGRVGMAIDTLRDFEIAFEGIDLDRITVSLTINGAAAILIAMYLAMAERRGFDVRALRGTAQNDILKEFIGRGTWIFPVEPSLKLVGDTIEYCAEHAPKYSPVSVCGYHIRESGANPAQEMAYAFCIARAYADEVLRRGAADRRVRRPAVVQLQHLRQPVRAGGEVPRRARAVGEDRARAVRGDQARLDVDADDRRRRRRRAHVRAARAQHRARRLLRADQRAVRRADDGAVLLRRGVHDPERARAADFAAHDAAADRGNGPLRHRRPARRLVLRRDAHQPDARRDGADHRRRRRARRHRRRWWAAAASRRRSRRRPMRTRRTSTPAASARSASTATASTRRTRRSSSTRTTKPTPRRRSRGSTRCAARATPPPWPRRSPPFVQAAADGRNTMPAIVTAVKAYASVGEITSALTEVYGRYREPIRF